MRIHSGRPGGCRSGWWLLALAGVLAAPAAVAEVVLQTEVARVETTLDETGRSKRELVPADEVVPGEELRYTITFSNTSDAVVDPERIVITNRLPDGTEYVDGSAGGSGTLVEYSTDGDSFASAPPQAGGGVHSLRWTFRQPLGAGETGTVYFHVRML